MALFKLNSDEALSSHNRHRKWPSNQRFGSETLHPLAQPHFDKKIQIESTDVIATFGSCFAKRVLFAMPKSMDIIRISDGYDCEDLEESRIRYNVFSMLNQLRWGFGLIDDELSYSGIFPTGKDNQFGDYHGHRLFLEDTPASELAVFYKDETAVRHSRMLYNEKFKQIERANVFIFTLGMAEVWYDQETNLHLNMMPPIPMMKKNKTRFEFQQLDYFDILNTLEEIHKVLKSQKGDDFKMLLTVSPVPYESTFNPTAGAIASNTYSKSVQRSAVENFVLNHNNTAYFPAYEMAMSSENQHVWNDDLVHVRQDFVDFIMAHFLLSLASDDLLDTLSTNASENVNITMQNILAASQELETTKSRAQINNLKEQFSYRNKSYEKNIERLTNEIEIKSILTEELVRENERLNKLYNSLFMEKIQKEMAL